MEARKIKGHARKQTITKYSTYLKSALIKIQKDPFYFSQAEFLKNNRLTANFFRALIDLKYLAATRSEKGKHYLVLVPWTQVTEEDGRKVAEYSLAYNYNHTNTPPNWLEEVAECCEQVFQKRSKLFKYSDEQLLNELRNRGYSGELNKNQLIKL